MTIIHPGPANLVPVSKEEIEAYRAELEESARYYQALSAGFYNMIQICRMREKSAFFGWGSYINFCEAHAYTSLLARRALNRMPPR